MGSFRQLIEDDNVRDQVINDCVAALEDEVNNKKGATGLAIKQGYKQVRKMKDGKIMHEAVDKLLNGFVGALEPFYREYEQVDESSRPADFGEYLKGREEEVTEQLLGVTDRRANKTDKKILVQAYKTLRPMAANQVKQGLPTVGNIVEKYAVS